MATITNAGAGGWPPQNAPNYPLKQGTEVTLKANTLFDSDGNTINLSIIYMKMLQTLLSKRYFDLRADSENITTSITGGTLIYYIQTRMITKTYTQGTELPSTVGFDKVFLSIDLFKEITFTYESMELEMLGAKLQDGGYTIDAAAVSGWLENKAKAFEAYIYAKVLDLAVRTAKANKVVDLKVPKNGSIDQYRMFWKNLSNSLKGLINFASVHYLGIDPEDGYLYISPLKYNDLLLATTNLGSEISTQSLQDGKILKIGGITIKETPLLGLKIEKGVLDKDEEFDYSGVDAIWVHKQALGFGFSQGQQSINIIPTNGNIINLHKFMVSNKGVALRPELAIAFTITEADSTQDFNEWVETFNKNISLSPILQKPILDISDKSGKGVISSINNGKIIADELKK